MAQKRPSTALIPELLIAEQTRQQESINLIASENYPSAAVRAALTSVAGSKYAEGYPGKRYYAGCQVIDEIEQAAQKTLLDLFVPRELQDSYHANMQPHAGSGANFAVYDALLTPGDTLLGMSLTHGGHLTHGHRANLSGKLYTIATYGVDPITEQLDYEAIRVTAKQCNPKLIIAGASAYSRTIDFSAFKQIADEVGAYFLADIAHIAGLIAAGQHPSPIPYADVITSTTHKTLRGPRGAFILCKQDLGHKIDAGIMPGSQGGPFMHVIAAKAIAGLEAQSDFFREYAARTCKTSKRLAYELSARGYHIVGGGTDTHLFLVNLTRSAGHEHLSGKAAEELLEQSGIVVNRNTVPGETRSPLVTSGIRIGLAAMATRGVAESDMPQLAEMIDNVLREKDSEKTKERVRDLALRCKLPD